MLNKVLSETLPYMSWLAMESKSAELAQYNLLLIATSLPL